MSMHSDQPAGYARFADGKSAGSSRVAVALGERGIAFETADGTPQIWPYGALETAVPLGRNAHDALITYKYAPGETLFLDDGPLIAALRERAGQLTTGAQRWRWAKPVIAGVAIAGLVAVIISLSNLRSAATIAGLIPQDTRESLGRHVVASMTSKYKRCEQPAGVAALAAMVARLKTGAGKDKFDVRVVDWDLVNAFAAPGGQIVMTRGMLTKSGGPDEVAAVLAHEMGHGIKLHPEASVVRSLGLSALVELMMGGSGGALSNIGILMAELSYSRDAEREADAVAVALLQQTKIPANGLASFFERIEGLKADRKKAQADKGDTDATGKKAGNAGSGGDSSGSSWNRSLEIFSTHPMTEERIANARKVPPYPSTPALDAAEWQALKAICGPPKPKQAS